ncbi:MAG: asparagine synthase, partial [Pseudonocardiaceae bacterium]
MYELTNSLVVVPDSPGGVRASQRVPHREPEVVAHPSGRPWLVGRWAPGELVVGGAGEVRIAVFGFCPVDSERLAAAAARVREPADLD